MIISKIGNSDARNKYVSLDKRSKKAQREYHVKQRIGKKFRNGFEADLFCKNIYFLLDYDVT